MKTAIFIRVVSEVHSGARLYSVSPPMVGYAWDDKDPPLHDFVVVSAVNVVFFGPETYIFGSNAEGEMGCMMELPGSFKGALDHAQALENAGYAIELKRANAPVKLLPAPQSDEPTTEQLEEWMYDGVCEATDGCRVEPDGHCEHGCPSWLLKLGLI